MAIEASMHPAVHKYLQDLELELKQLSGVSPEEALSDAREFLMRDSEALHRSGEPPDEETYYQWIVDKFGTAKTVAQQYGDHADAAASKAGYAPGWRICCTRCGRSAPLASVGAVRIGAKSIHKYTLGYCRDCKRLRFLRIIQDLHDANLTERLGIQKTPAEMRSMHKPVAVIVGILAIVLFVLLTVFAILFMLLK